MHLKSLNPAIKIRLSLVVVFTCAPLLSQAQLGVSPSQNAAFLTELRARDPKRAEENKDVMGDDREKLEAGRALSRPGVFNASQIRTHRLEADRIGGFPSQYQLGRSYLSPWYDGVEAPETSLESTAGLRAGFALEQQIEYNSGVKDGAGGMVLSTAFLFDGSYKLAENQRLTLSGGIGFNWISGNDHIDWNYFSDEFGMGIMPGSSIAYDAQFGPVAITLYDRVSSRPYIGVLQNDLGIAATWQVVEALSWTLNYTRTTTHDIDGTYPAGAWVNFDLDAFSSLLNYDINSSLSVGLEGAMSWIYHEYGRDLNNGQHWSAGVYAVWKLTENARLRIAAGYQRQKFDDTMTESIFGPSILPDSREEVSDPYYAISFSQRLSERFSHEFAVGYESNVDFTSNFISSHYANYGLTAKTWKGGQITASGFVELSDRSDYQFLGETGTGEIFKTYGVDLHASQQLTSKTDVSIGYSFARFDNEQGRVPFANFGVRRGSFNQHMAGVNVGYALTPKVRLNLAYQAAFWGFKSVPMEDNHRVILGVRVQF